MKPTTPAFIATTTVERRTVLRWLGNATVLSLGGSALSACYGGSIADQPAPGTGAHDGGTPSAPAFPFAPGSGQGEIFTDWAENTVDEQDLTNLLANWTLTIDGLVTKPQVLRFPELLRLTRQDQVTDFHCVGGWSVEDVPWNGIRLAHLLDLVGVAPATTHLTFYSEGGKYTESLPLAIAREPRTMLAYGVGGSTLPLVHGFPLRLVVPRLFGYKNAKYLSRIEVTDHAVDGFWELYGYTYAAEVPDSRLRPGKY